MLLCCFIVCGFAGKYGVTVPSTLTKQVAVLFGFSQPLTINTSGELNGWVFVMFVEFLYLFIELFLNTRTVFHSWSLRSLPFSPM